MRAWRGTVHVYWPQSIGPRVEDRARRKERWENFSAPRGQRSRVDSGWSRRKPAAVPRRSTSTTTVADHSPMVTLLSGKSSRANHPRRLGKAVAFLFCSAGGEGPFPVESLACTCWSAFSGGGEICSRHGRRSFPCFFRLSGVGVKSVPVSRLRSLPMETRHPPPYETKGDCPVIIPTPEDTHRDVTDMLLKQRQ
ncbi:hypothetical protein NL676_037969 [Syzygium grande]|nr:hypothetical protein NL676_037969 [Syzygium grande]